MASRITVTVSGPVGSGKSAICGEIEIAMKAIGVPVQWDDEGEKRMTHADWQGAIDMYQPAVTIREVNPAMERETSEFKLRKRPVAFRVRAPEGTGWSWLYYADEQKAAASADNLGVEYDALYVRDGTPLVA